MNTRIRNNLLFGTAFVILAAGVTYACKDFLNTPAQGTLDEEVLANQAGVEGSLIATYRSLDCSNSSGAWGCAASNWVWGSVASDDAYKGSNAGDQQPINDIEVYNWSTGEADAYIGQKWHQVYEGISRANATLRLLDKVVAAGGIDATDADGIHGEAIFLRAHYHFEAWRMWGNIPYYRSDDLDYRKANESEAAVANDLIVDLDSAIALLPATPRNGQVGRATSWTAKAYKGRVLMYDAGLNGNTASYAAAATVLQDVVDNGPYGLETSFDHVWTGFPQYQNGPETIFAYQASVRDGEPNGENSNFGERLNFPYAGSHFGCCGFHQPSQNLVNFFSVDGTTGLPLALTDPTWNTRDTSLTGGILTPVDPRLDWTVGRDNTPYKDWGLHDRSWIRDASYSGPYSPKKNVHEAAADAENNVGWVPTQTNDVNIHLFRYADLLLMLAEADVEGGNLELARGIVNQIRARAGQIAQGCGTPGGTAGTTETTLYPSCTGVSSMTVQLVHATIDSLTTPWAAYRIGQYPGPWTDQAFARTAVRYERRVELAMEGQRFFDLRRWGAADTTLNNYVAVEKTRRPYLTLAAPFTARYSLYPIPSLQIELSRVGTEDRLTQNPGW
jgi:hypothetical protein